MRIPGIAVRWLFVLCIPVLLITASQSWLINSLWFWERGFLEYDVSQKTGIAHEELVRAAGELLDYFNSPEEFISNPVVIRDGEPFALFTELDILHLRYVRVLFRLGYYSLGVSLAFVVIFSLVMWRKRRGRMLAQGVFRGSILTLGLMGALGLGALVAFDQLWRLWRVPVFSWGFGHDAWRYFTWNDYLIQLFPGGFWFDGVILASLAIAVAAVLLGGTAWYFNRKLGK